mgnify:FL=1
MERPFYRDRLAEKRGIATIVPDEDGRATVHRIIYEELCEGVVTPASKQAYLDEVKRLTARGADGVILGCTEITMLIGQDDFDIPVFDTTWIHASAAMDFALGAKN